MDIHEKTIVARMLTWAQSTAPKSAVAGGRISGDKLARVLTPALGMTGQQTASGLPGAAGPKSGLYIAQLMSLLRAIQRLPRLSHPPLTSKYEVSTVLKTLMRDINTQRSHPTQTKPRPLNRGNTHPVACPGIGPAYVHKLGLKQALATAVNLSVAVGYLNTALGFNRLMKILEYALKTQTSNETTRLIPTGSAPPLSPFIALMFSFHALQNKRKRRRAKAKVKLRR
tara:strand:+ start:204 stop:884 length:681 start_codon:yes stop_codon:yes gene_type:complete